MALKHPTSVNDNIMLFGLNNPHFIAYLPAPWVADMLSLPAQGSGHFDHLTVTVFGRPASITSTKYISHLKAKGFDPKTVKFHFFGAQEGRVLAARLAKPASTQVDVQLIGPFKRVLGLGDSCRRLSRLICALGYSTNLFDFDLQNNSPEGDDINVKLGALQRARINILHLNAETLPSAFAYLPDVFTGAYNIAFCY
jgi:hypothetical protein